MDVDIAVEMMAEELYFQKYLAPVIGNEKLEQHWPQISRKVTSLLQSIPATRSHTTNTSLFHLGYSLAADANPIRFIYRSATSAFKVAGRWCLAEFRTSWTNRLTRLLP